MPTTKHRYAITETETVQAALTAAAQRWPQDRGRPSKLLRNLIEVGYEAIAPEAAQRTESRQAAIADALGAGTGLYGAGYLEELRQDWPE